MLDQAFLYELIKLIKSIKLKFIKFINVVKMIKKHLVNKTKKLSLPHFYKTKKNSPLKF